MVRYIYSDRFSESSVNGLCYRQMASRFIVAHFPYVRRAITFLQGFKPAVISQDFAPVISQDFDSYHYNI